MIFHSATIQTHCHLSTSQIILIGKVLTMKHFGSGGKIWHQNIIPGILTWTSNKFVGIQRETLNTGTPASCRTTTHKWLGQAISLQPCAVLNFQASSRKCPSSLGV